MKSAIFSDHQNAHFCLHDALHGVGSCKDVWGQHKVLVDLPGLVKQIHEHYGPVALARAYADWSYFREYVPDLNRSLVELVHVPYVKKCKNSADMRLALDAYAETANAPDITTVVIFSCDSDFSDLAVRLRRLGKTVVGIGVEGANIRPEWVKACDKFYRYPIPKRAPDEPEEPEQPPRPLPVLPVPSANGTSIHNDEEQDESDEIAEPVSTMASRSGPLSKPLLPPIRLLPKPLGPNGAPRSGPFGPKPPAPQPNSTTPPGPRPGIRAPQPSNRPSGPSHRNGAPPGPSRLGS